VIWILIAFGAALLWRRPAIVALVATAVWGADLISLGIKEAVGRPRPFVADAEPAPLLLGVVGDSFPSGHAATSFAGAAMLMRYLAGRWLVLFGLAAAIGFSRVYVGVHYPSDVVGGALLGLLAAAVVTALPRLGAIRRRAPRSRPPG
jgi:undecaprenyl-diphosphatase